jgi:hypothetical protein
VTALVTGRWARKQKVEYRHTTRAKSGREGSDDEELESGDLSGTSSEKQRLFETREQLREAQQEALHLAGEIHEDDEAEDDDADEDDDDDTRHAADAKRRTVAQTTA